MGCGASAPVKPAEINSVVPDSPAAIKTHTSTTAVGSSADFQLVLEKPLIDAETALFDCIRNLVTEYERRLQSPDLFHFMEQSLVGATLRSCIFVGHVQTDLDSVGGALGAAVLFGGIAARSEDALNGEIDFALHFAELDAPTHFDSLPGGGDLDPSTGQYKKVCLVDHNEEKQMTPKLRDCPTRRDRIVGLIDHHAVSEAFCTERSLFMDVRPWGSMSTIVAHTFLREAIHMPKQIARILLCAILSDTLDLQSVTTTQADKLMVGVLAMLGEVKSAQAIHDLASKMFTAKTQWILSQGSRELVRGDQKDFSANGWRFGISVLEVTCGDEVMPKADEIARELRELKNEKGGGDPDKELHFAFCFIVDVTKQLSNVVICSMQDLELARLAFPQGKLQGVDGDASSKLQQGGALLMHVGNLVSRKSQFAPALLKALNDGFTLSQVTENNVSQMINDLSASQLEDFVDSVLAEPEPVRNN